MFKMACVISKRLSGSISFPYGKCRALVPQYRAAISNGRPFAEPRRKLNQEVRNANSKHDVNSSKVVNRNKPVSQSSYPSASTLYNPNSDARGPDATTFFKLTNPEMFMDTKKRSTWFLVGAVWIVFGSYTGYLFYKDAQKDKDLDKISIGPRKRSGGY